MTSWDRAQDSAWELVGACGESGVLVAAAGSRLYPHVWTRDVGLAALVAFVYGATFGVGMLLLGPRAGGAALVAGAAVAAVLMLRLLRRQEEEPA